MSEPVKPAAEAGKGCLGGCILTLMALTACGWTGVLVLFGKLQGWWA